MAQLSTSFWKAVSVLRRDPSSDSGGRLECPRKGGREYRQNEKWKYHLRNGGYDAQQAKCTPTWTRQSRGRISKHKVMCPCGMREADGDKVYEDEVSDLER